MSLVRSASLALAGAMAAVAALANVMAPEPGDMQLGSPRAPVTVIEYASVGCPHCALWDAEVFPAFKARYVETGRVRFVVREMSTGSGAIATAGFLLARCAGATKYFQVMEAVYRRLGDMSQPGASPGDVLLGVAKSVGMSEDDFKACLTDQKALDAFNARVSEHVTSDKVDSTPTFFVNGQRLEGDLSLSDFAAAIKAARRMR
jgi:protein-disulfide isomerase